MKKTILTVTAICLAAVLLCSAACFATASYVHKQALVSGPALSAAPAESAGLKASSLALPSSGGERTAEEIYQLACKQVVGISTTVTGYRSCSLAMWRASSAMSSSVTWSGLKTMDVSPG